MDEALKIIENINPSYFSPAEKKIIVSIAKKEVEGFSAEVCAELRGYADSPNAAAVVVKQALRKMSPVIVDVLPVANIVGGDEFQELVKTKCGPLIAKGDKAGACDELIALCERFNRNPYTEANKLRLRLPADDATKEKTRALARRVSSDPAKGYAPRHLTVFAIPGELPLEQETINGIPQFLSDGTKKMVPIGAYEITSGNTRITHHAGDREVGLANGTFCTLVEIAIATKYLRQPKDENGNRDPVLLLGRTKEEFFGSFDRYNNPFYAEVLIEALEKVVNTSRTIRKFDKKGEEIERVLQGVRVGDLFCKYSKNGDAEKYPDWVGVLELTLEYTKYLEKNFLHVDLTVANKFASSERDMAIYLWLVNKASWFTYNGNSKKKLTVTYDEIGELYGDQITRHDHKVSKIRASLEKVLELSGLPLLINASGAQEVVIRHSALAQIVGPKKRIRKKE